MSEQVAGTENANGKVGIVEGMANGVDAIFDEMISGIFGDRSELQADMGDVLKGVVGVFDDRLEAVNADIREKGGDGAVSPAAIERRDTLAAMRDRAAERYLKETGKEWQRD